MRFLMIAMQYPAEQGRSYLTTELADALVDAGHEVEVLHLDWHGAGKGVDEYVTPTGVRVVRTAARALGRGIIRKASKFLLSGRHAGKVAREYFDLSSFDVSLTWMPSVAIAPVIPMLRRAGIRHRLLFIWDFFPLHHREIGVIPAGLPFRIARTWEQRLLGEFTAIVCNLPGNIDYLRRHYRIRAGQRTLSTPLWTDSSRSRAVDRSAMRRRHGLPLDRPIIVFGGQIVEGRGFEQMLAAANAECDGRSPLFLFVGDGRLAPMVRARAEAHDNVVWRAPLPREDYLDLLAACDVGMAATVPGVTSYSFPTKTLEYLRAGLPVLAAVEHGSDYAAIIDRYGVGAVVPFEEPARFMKEAERLVTDPAARAAAREGAARCLDELFDVRHAVATVIEATRSGVNEVCR